MNITIKGKIQQSWHSYKPLKMNGIQNVFANYLWTMFWGSVFWIFWIMWFFPRKYKYRCIRVYVWFKDDKHVIWIWLILKNISLLDRIWNLWLVRFVHSPPNFIFWLGRLIFSVSINSHPDNIYRYRYKFYLKSEYKNIQHKLWRAFKTDIHVNNRTSIRTDMHKKQSTYIL